MVTIPRGCRDSPIRKVDALRQAANDKGKGLSPREPLKQDGAI